MSYFLGFANLQVFFLVVCSYHVTYPFQSESTLYSCLNVKELLARSRDEIWSLSDCNWTRTQNHLVRKKHSTIWLSVRLRTKWFRVRVQLQSFFLVFQFLYHRLESFEWRIHSTVKHKIVGVFSSFDKQHYPL